MRYRIVIKTRANGQESITLQRKHGFFWEWYCGRGSDGRPWWWTTATKRKSVISVEDAKLIIDGDCKFREYEEGMRFVSTRYEVIEK